MLIRKMSKFTVIRAEEEVGILYRVGSHSRFQGTFKQRFSDFHVNEIDLNGKIVQLTTLEAPCNERKNEISENDSQITGWISEDVRNCICSLQTRLQNAVTNASTKSDPVWKEKIEVKVTNLNKEERTRIHKWLGNFDKLTSETLEKDGEKFIVVLYESKNVRSKRRPAARPKYTHCTLYKEGVDTAEAIGLLSKKLRLKPNLITFCGTKDKYGKTTQRICFSNIEASRLVQISNETKSIKLGNFLYQPHHLRLGDLNGNHFKILLRDVIADSVDIIISAVESLKSSGFINYFGLQRFGSYEVSTHTIGKSILQLNWMEAFDFILNPRANDSEFMKKAKNDWLKNRDPSEAIKRFPHWHRSIESNLLHGLAKYYSKNDHIGAFMRLPRNTRHLYIHSFQSFLWNKIASYRIRELGLEPVVGDVVYMDKDQDDFCCATLEEEEEDLDVEDQSGSNALTSRTFSANQKVKILTSEDLPNYTIYDILIPIQGSQIKIPEGPIRKYYDELLQEQNLDADCFLKYKPVADQPKGAYRKLILRPQNVSSKIILYNDSDPVDTFIPSELDRVNEQEQKNVTDKGSTTHQSVSVSFKDDELLKDKKCVLVEFSLPSSSYATMALRELIVTNSEKGPAEAVNIEKCDGGNPKILTEHDDEPKIKRRRENENND